VVGGAESAHPNPALPGTCRGQANLADPTTSGLTHLEGAHRGDARIGRSHQARQL